MKSELCSSRACLDMGISLPRHVLGKLVPKPLFDFSAAKRTNTRQDEVIILALAKSCYSTHNLLSVYWSFFYCKPGILQYKSLFWSLDLA